MPPTTTTSAVLHPTLSTPPPTIVRASGLYLTTSTGVSILDASGGAAVSCIGHAHPRVQHAMQQQMRTVDYAFAPHFSTTAYEELASFLAASTNYELPRAFVTGSGSEAVEAGIKMARQYAVERGEVGRTKFIARQRSYHGNTLGSLGVSGHVARRRVFEPLLQENVSFVSPCYAYRELRQGETGEMYVERLVEELETEFQRVGPETVCAVLFETVAGLTLGAVAPLPGYLKAMKAVCEKHGALFMLDEVLAGMGRTGTLHAWQQEDVVPDLQTVAKGLGGGYAPIGALLVGKKVLDTLERGSGAFAHFQTYHGHPLACAAALEVQRIIRDEGLVENCKFMGEYLGEQLKRRLGGHRHVGDVRGRGLVWAVELVKDRETKEPFAVEERVALRIHEVGLRRFEIAVLPGGGVVDGVRGDVVVVAPAYTVKKEDVRLIVERLAKAVEEVLGGGDVKAML